MNSSLRSANNLTKVIVAKGAAAHGLADGTSVAGGLADGIVATVTPGLKTFSTPAGGFTAVAAGTKFQIVQGTGVGKPLIMSPIMTSTSYTLSRARFKAATEQVTFIGYNGSTGALDADTASTSYVVTLVMTNPNEKDRSQPTRVYGQYTTPASGMTNAISALALANSLIKNFSTKSDDLVKIERVASGASVAPGTATNGHTFTKGSKTVSVADVDDATGGDAYAVGDYIRVGTTLSDAVYGIAAIDTTANTLTLDQAFQGDTVTFAADTSVKRVDAAALGNFGLKLTGVARAFDVASNRNYYKVRFVVSLGEVFLATGVTTTTKAHEGIGTPNQVAMDYYESMGFQGQGTDTIGVPPVANLSAPAALTGEYGVLNLSMSNAVSSIVSQSSLKSNFIVYLEYSDGVTGGTDDDVSANGEEIVGNSTLTDLA